MQRKPLLAVHFLMCCFGGLVHVHDKWKAIDTGQDTVYVCMCLCIYLFSICVRICVRERIIEKYGDTHINYYVFFLLKACVFVCVR